MNDTNGINNLVDSIKIIYKSITLKANDETTQCVLDIGYLDCDKTYFNHMISTQRREIMWSFSNIFAGNQQQIKYK